MISITYRVNRIIYMKERGGALIEGLEWPRGLSAPLYPMTPHWNQWHPTSVPLTMATTTSLWEQLPTANKRFYGSSEAHVSSHSGICQPFHRSPYSTVLNWYQNTETEFCFYQTIHMKRSKENHEVNLHKKRMKNLHYQWIGPNNDWYFLIIHIRF